MRRKKVIIWSDYPLTKTGQARNSRELALYLYNTGKYEVVFYANGMSIFHPDFAKFPFKVIGSLPNDPAAMDAINKGDEGYKRAAAYGIVYVDELIKNERPQALIMLNDSWGHAGVYDKSWYNQLGHIPSLTLDSTPFLPDQKVFIEKSQRFYVWTEFAKDEAERLGYKHVGVIPGIVNPALFKKTPKHVKDQLRQKFNIPKDAFVVGFVFRNQIRKLPDTLLQAFAIFKKENPTAKLYLLFFTHFDEPAGWNIPLLIKEAGVSNENVLTCYICRNCTDYEVKPYTGQNLNCKCCGAEQSQVTCNIAAGIKEEELNDVYGLMDLYCHPITNGGLEFPCVESLYCELPLATIPYSSGETFTRQDFVFTIDCTYTLQHSTQFKRAVPSPYSISKIIKKVYEMPPEKRDEIGQKGRKWALSKFTPDVVGKQYEEIIDAMPFYEYEVKNEVKVKDPNFPFPKVDSPEEFIKSLYNNILKVEGDPQGMQYWQNTLKAGSSREQIYAYFIDLARKDNEKAGVNTKSIEDFIDKESTNKRFLIVLKESAGDIINATALLESFKESYPDWDLYFACDPQYFELLEGNPYLYRVIPFHQSMLFEPAMTGQGSHKGWFSGYCNLGIATQQVLNYLSHDKIALTLKD